MSPRPAHPRYRTLLSQLLAIMLGAVLLVTDSSWDRISIVSTVLFALGCVLASVATVGRLWCFLYISGHKKETLVTAGPYSLCRNPLYFFSLIGAIGVGLATETLLMPLIILVIFALYYPAVIRHEEARLQALHGEELDAYRRSTPAFLPRLSLLNEPDEYTVRPKFVRRHLLDTLWFIWIIALLRIVQALHEARILPVLFRFY